MKLQQALAIHEHSLDCVNEETLRACARVLGDALLQKQKAFDELCQVWDPVYNYARNHPDITLGESVVGFALELMRKADALREQKPVGEVSGHDTELGLLYDNMEPGARLYAAPAAPAPSVPEEWRGFIETASEKPFVYMATRAHWDERMRVQVQHFRCRVCNYAWTEDEREQHHGGCLYVEARALLQSAGGAK